MKIAVIGGTGRLGKPVANAFKKAGYEVTLVVRDASWALEQVQSDFGFATANVNSVQQLTQALLGMDAVYISLSGFDEAQCQKVIHQGTKNIVAAAKICGVKTLGFLSGSHVNEENSHKHYEVKARYQAELAIKSSGLNYLFFCPSWFMETLPMFVRDGKGCLFAKSRQKIHWLAVDDYATMVVKAFGDARLNSSRIILRGPEPLTLEQALKRYFKSINQDEAFTIMPVYLAWVMVSFGGKKTLLHWANMCRYFESVGEEKDDGLASKILPVARFNLDAWCQMNVAKKFREGDNLLEFE